MDYDVVVVDCPPTLHNDQLAAVIEVSDFVVVPTEPEGLPVTSVIKTVQEVLQPSGVPFRVLINKLVPQSSDTEVRTALQQLQIPVFATSVRQYKAHATAPVAGRVVTQFGNADIKAKSDWVEVAMELFALFDKASNSPAVDLRDPATSSRGQ